jgi:4-alpha-glucanotransferase
MNHAEGQAVLPPFSKEHRTSGVLLHVTSLPSPYGIGDVGPAAVSWVDQLYEAGQSWWQALPLGPTGYGNSPYQSLSSFAGNALLVSPDLLVQDGLLGAGDCDEGHNLPKEVVDFEAVTAFKHRLLEQAWSNFSSSRLPALRADFDQFCSEQAHWLEDYALFRALKFHFKGADFLDWPQELVRRNPSALARVRRDLEQKVNQIRFAQFLLFRQGERLKQYAHERGIRLIGDLPFFVSQDSSDVWANPEWFQLDRELRPRLGCASSIRVPVVHRPP